MSSTDLLEPKTVMGQSLSPKLAFGIILALVFLSGAAAGAVVMNLGVHNRLHQPAFDTAAGRLGTLVCWDQWYPEGARLTALQGASILFYPTAIGWHPAEKAEFGEAQHDAWRTIQRAHAIANGVYVGVVNRVGFETGNIRGNSVPGKGLEFWGGSFFSDPFGRVLAEASHDREEILLGEVDLHQLEDIRRNWPFLRDRRIDSYAPITSRMLDGK